MSVDITVNETVNDVEIVVQPNVIEVNVTRTSGSGGGGAVNSVNGQTGTVVLDADDIGSTSTINKFVTASEKTAITHANRSTLDAITEAFTTALKTAYDGAVTWISTNGANVLSHIANTSNPHNTTATQVDALKRDGSNANSDVDLGAFSINAKAVKVNGTGGAGNVGLKHQSTNATASTNETAIFAGSDGELYYKNDGNSVAQIASRAWVGAQGFVINVISALGFTPENSANKSTSTSDSASTTKFPVWSVIVSYFSASQIRSILGISTLSGSNTGDETNASIISKIGFTPENSANKGTVLGNLTSTTIFAHAKGVVDYVASLGYQTASNVASAIATALVGYATENWVNARLSNIAETTTDGTVSSGTSNTVTMTLPIPANTFGANQMVDVIGIVRATGTAGTRAVRLYVNTSADLSGTPILIGAYTGITATNLEIPIQRFLRIKVANGTGAGTEVMNTGNNVASAYGPSTSAVTTCAIDWTALQYLVMTVQATNGTDSLRGTGLKIRR